MKLKHIIALFTLSIIAKGFVQTLSPILLSIGAAISALNSDILYLDVQPIKWKNWLALSEKGGKEEKEEALKEVKEELLKEETILGSHKHRERREAGDEWWPDTEEV